MTFTAAVSGAAYAPLSLLLPCALPFSLQVVLALYPQTTCFYKAVVHDRPKDVSPHDPASPDHCCLCSDEVHDAVQQTTALIVTSMIN